MKQLSNPEEVSHPYLTRLENRERDLTMKDDDAILGPKLTMHLGNLDTAHYHAWGIFLSICDEGPDIYTRFH